MIKLVIQQDSQNNLRINEERSSHLNLSEGLKRRLNANDIAFEGMEMLGMNATCSSCNKFKILNSIIQTNEAHKRGGNPKIQHIPQLRIFWEGGLQSQNLLNYSVQAIP